MTIRLADLAARRQSGAPARPSHGPLRSSTGSVRKPRVLIVEDHEDTRSLYAWCLRAAGWHVDEVVNGAEAIAIAAAFAPDVIVMDLHLPVLDGIAATQLLRKDPRTAQIPIVACTAYSRLHSAAELRDAGIDEVVAKPCTPEDLRDVLEKVVLARSG